MSEKMLSCREKFFGFFPKPNQKQMFQISRRLLEKVCFFFSAANHKF